MKRFLCLIAFLGFSTLARAESLSLDDVVLRVRQTHPAIRESVEDAKEAKSRRLSESWLPDPKGGIEFYQVPASSRSLRNADEINYKISQEIPFPGTLITKNRALSAEYKAKQSWVTETERRKVFEAKQIFFDLFAVRRQVAGKQKTVNSYNQLLISLETRYRSQSATGKEPKAMPDDTEKTAMEPSALSDYLMAKMKKVEAEAALHDLHHKESGLASRLNLFLGRPAGETIPPLKEPSVKTLALDDEILEAKLTRQNSDLKSLEWMKTKAKREVALAGEKFIPTVEPMFTYSQRQNMENAYTVGFNFNIPIWLHRNVAEINAATASARKAENARQARTLELKSELYDLINHTRWHQIIVRDYLSQIIPLAQSAMNIALTAYKANQITTESMMQKIIAYEEARVDYWSMWKEYQTDYALLEQLVGEDL